jgi:hypothetical protein
MDRVRFGRALGFGTKQAVKTLMAAVDAATAENPSARSASRIVNTGQAVAQPRVSADAGARVGVTEPARQTAVAPTTGAATREAAKKAAQVVYQTRDVKQGLGRGTRRFGEAIWRPFVRLSGVLWLEVSGVFFGIFALMALGFIWKFRGAWRANAANAGEHRSLMGAAVILALFGYFCVSSFVRARRRERGR